MKLLRTVCGVICAIGWVAFSPGATAASSGAANVFDLLRTSQYSELDKKLSAVQESYEKATLSEVELRAEFRLFYETYEDLSSSVNAWVKEMPDSYAAHLSRGIYFRTRAIRARGAESALETSPKQFADMRSHFEVAAKELGASLKLTRKPLLTYLYALDVSNFNGDGEDSRRILDSALEIDPRTFVIRLRYMGTLETRWGGSQTEMLAFLKECERAKLDVVALSRLRAAVLEDQAWIARFVDDEPKKAADLYMEAVKLGSDTSCAVCAGEAYFDVQEFALAIDAFSTALAAKPLDAHAYYNRGMAYLYANRPQEARSDLERSAQMGNAAAQFALGQCLVDGTFGTPREKELGTEWIRKAAGQRYGRALEYLSDHDQ